MRKLVMSLISALAICSAIKVSHAGLTIDASNYQNYIIISGGEVALGDVNGGVALTTYSTAAWSTNLRLWFLPYYTEGGRFINYVIPFNDTPDCPADVLNSPPGQRDEAFVRWANEFINSHPIIPYSNRVGDFNKPIEKTSLNDFVTLACVYDRRERLVVYAPFRNTRIINPPEGNPPEETECIPGVVTPSAPREIDFGTLDHNQLAQSVMSDRFFFRFEDDLVNQECNSTVEPIVRFSSAEKVVDNEIYLANGTILSLYTNQDEKIPLDTPITNIHRISPSSYQIIMKANLRSNPNQPLIAGPFSTTVVYQIEYR